MNVVNTDEIANLDWYTQAMNGRPHLTYVGKSAVEGLEKVYGVSYKHALFEMKGNTLTVHYSKKGLELLRKFIFSEYRKDRDFVNNVLKSAEEILQEERTFIELKELSELSIPELVSTYHQVHEYYHSVWNVFHLIEGFTLTTDIMFKEKLQKHLEIIGRANEFNALFSSLTRATTKSFMNKISEDMNAVIREIKEKNLDLDSEDTTALLKQYAQKFYWIKNSFMCREVLDEEYFREELKELINKPVSEMENFAQNEATKKQLIQELELDCDLKELITLTDQFFALQDKRKEYTLFLINDIEAVLEEIATRKDIDIELLRQLFYYEVTEEALENLPLGLIEMRKEGFAMFYDTNGDHSIVNDEYVELMSKLKQENIEIKEINGMTASLGRIIGRVKVCMNSGHLQKIEKGDILVTSMTRPEFVPAMKKVAGVITDEGGITCHAAIVSRELGIPCLIGTKMATKVLKDNMLIQLKATHGVAQIVETEV